MYSRFKIDHDAVDWPAMLALLAAHYGTDDRSVLSRSQLLSTGAWSKVKKLFATDSPDCRLVFTPGSSSELQIYVEPVEGNAMNAALSAWKGVRKILHDKSPKLSHLVMVDEQSRKEFLTGETGIKIEFKRKETILPIAIGVATIIYVSVGLFTFAAESQGKFIGGALTGIIGAIASVVFAVLEVRKGTLRWK
ncbi:hypothetical protein DMB66_43900 [Actinoplanes sp. ATCC 53533]|uniref:hypothetical protein n=1 Tax=Actinoplanes sp. ATCC 53533 TaxID=1288362 RepID=UPI000F7AD255|nr:hypothetical protein [Actinoplanes sp. ATCC 53533]RSM49989.1 hypothetical protein DMB66_43900 [Actinoplanes sp. ATCC 53533]